MRRSWLRTRVSVAAVDRQSAAACVTVFPLTVANRLSVACRLVQVGHAAAVLAELPLTVTSVSVSVPPSLYRPPPKSALPPVIVRPDSAAGPWRRLEHPAGAVAADRQQVRPRPGDRGGRPCRSARAGRWSG